jgi:hypothetical protein
VRRARQASHQLIYLPIIGEATWPGIMDRATRDRLVGLLGDEGRRPANFGRPRVYPLAGLPLRVLLRTAGHLPAAEADARLRLPEGREPLL